MPRPRRNQPSEPPGPRTVDPVGGIALLVDQINKARELSNSPVSGNDYDSWVLLTENYLRMAFGSESDNVSRVLAYGRHIIYPTGKGETWWANDRAERLKSMVRAMESLVVLLETEARLAGSTQLDPTTPTSLNRVFLVHGHNNEVLQETARFLEKLKLDVVVLREQPNQGRTVIEKFEDYADVGFAVVLLTPDDVGGESSSELQGRARQNVIFELGYFLAKLGRDRVCVLHVPTLEIPSDYPVLYVPFDDNWRLALAKEMRAARLDIDMNLVV